jgi:hypothetical protein
MPPIEKEDVAALIKRIKTDNTEDLEFNLGFSTIADEELNDLCEAIRSTKNAKSLSASLWVTPDKAESLFYAFFANNSLNTLFLPLYGVLNHPSQKYHCKFKYEFEESVKAHNKSRETQMQMNGFAEFKKAYSARLTAVLVQQQSETTTEHKRRRVEQPNPNGIVDRIEEFLYPAKKYIDVGF